MFSDQAKAPGSGDNRGRADDDGLIAPALKPGGKCAARTAALDEKLRAPARPELAHCPGLVTAAHRGLGRSCIVLLAGADSQYGAVRRQEDVESLVEPDGFVVVALLRFPVVVANREPVRELE